MAEGSQQPEDLSRTVSGGSEFYFDFYCFPCHEDGRYFEAVGYCKDCGDYLCDECYRIHPRSKPSRHHVLLDSEHMPKDLTSSRRVVHTDKCTDTCKKHPDKIIEYFCHIHDILACSTCAFADHRNCNKIDLIADVADRSGESKELGDAQAQLQVLADQASQTIHTSQNNISLSNKYSNHVMISINTYINETIATLEKFEKELEAEAKELDSKNEQRLQIASSESNSILVEIKATLQGLSILEKNKQFCNLFVAVKKAQKTLPRMTRELDRTRQDSMVDELKFEPNLELQSILSHIRGIGNIIIPKAHSEKGENKLDQTIKQKATCTSVIPDPCQNKVLGQNNANILLQTDGDIAGSVKRTQQPRIAPYENENSADNVKHKDIKARHITDITVTCKSDKEYCDISGVATLPDGKLVAVDKGNSKVKVIDIHKQNKVYELRLLSEPWDVSSVDRDKIVVTLPNIRKTQYLNISANGTISTSGNAKVNGNCLGIAFARGKLWVSYRLPGKLEALTLDGEVLLCISTDESGKAIFSWPHYVALSPDMETIYVSDCTKDTVFCLSSTGKLISVCKFDYHPTGLAVASDGTVTCGGQEVYMLTAECEKIKKLLDEKRIGGLPQSMAFDEDTRRLFVGHFYSGLIKRFHLSGF